MTTKHFTVRTGHMYQLWLCGRAMTVKVADKAEISATFFRKIVLNLGEERFMFFPLAP